jgi:putative transport protein
MSGFVSALQHNPELAIFLTLALGFFIGRLKIGSFSLGTVVGTLLAGVVVGQLSIQVPAVSNIPIAYAVTYLIGTAGLVWFLPVMGPKLMRVNLREESRKLQAQGSGARELEPGVVSAARRFDVRAYRVTNDALVNKTVTEIEGLPKDFRVFILRVRRQGALIEPEPATVIRRDDVAAVAARHQALVERGSAIGSEVEDRELLDIPIEVGRVFGWLRSVRPFSAALRAVQDEAQSKVPALGYTVPYAIGNILLTAWGPVIVALMSIGR